MAQPISTFEEKELSGQMGAAAKTLLVLSAFRSSAEVVGVSEMSRRLALPKSTAFRLLRVLVEAGYVHRLPAGYQLSAQLAKLTSSALTRFAQTLRPALLPCLVDLHHVTGAPVSLFVGEGGLVRCVERVHSLRQAALAQCLPDDVPAHTTLPGKVMMAYAPSNRMPEPAMSRGIHPELQQIRASGVAVEQTLNAVGFTAIVAPVLDHDRNAVAALSVLVPTSMVCLESVTSRLRAAAHTCSVVVTVQRRRATGTSPAA